MTDVRLIVIQSAAI